MSPALGTFTGELVKIEQQDFGYPIRLVGHLADDGLIVIVMPALA